MSTSWGASKTDPIATWIAGRPRKGKPALSLAQRPGPPWKAAETASCAACATTQLGSKEYLTRQGCWESPRKNESVKSRLRTWNQASRRRWLPERGKPNSKQRQSGRRPAAPIPAWIIEATENGCVPGIRRAVWRTEGSWGSLCKQTANSQRTLCDEALIMALGNYRSPQQVEHL